jgi:endonuclease/exonuclease/phosphatase (EEP) superfamily protein YafD
MSGYGRGGLRRGRVSTTLATAAFLVLAVPACAATARWLAWDRTSLLVAVNAAGPLPYASAPLGLMLALACRRWAAIGTAIVVVTASGVVVVPELAARHATARLDGAPTMRVFSANVYAYRKDLASMAPEIVGSHADLVVLLEAGERIARRLEAVGAVDGLEFRAENPVDTPSGYLIASRWPISGVQRHQDSGVTYAMTFTVATPGGPLQVIAVHTIAPVGLGRRLWPRQLAAIGDLVRQRPGPLLVVGDFNSGWDNRGFQRLLHEGLVDGAAARGRWFDATWPRGRWFPPLLRIDHILTRGGPVVRSVRLGDGKGSDHRPLVAELALRP